MFKPFFYDSNEWSGLIDAPEKLRDLTATVDVETILAATMAKPVTRQRQDVPSFGYRIEHPRTGGETLEAWARQHDVDIRHLVTEARKLVMPWTCAKCSATGPGTPKDGCPFCGAGASNKVAPPKTALVRVIEVPSRHEKEEGEFRFSFENDHEKVITELGLKPGDWAVIVPAERFQSVTTSPKSRLLCRVVGVAYEDGVDECEEEQAFRVKLEPAAPWSDNEALHLDIIVRRDELASYPLGADVFITIEPKVESTLKGRRVERATDDYVSALIDEINAGAYDNPLTVAWHALGSKERNKLIGNLRDIGIRVFGADDIPRPSEIDFGDLLDLEKKRYPTGRYPRRTERKNPDGTWTDVEFNTLKKGDTFRLTDTAPTPTHPAYEDGTKEYVALGDAEPDPNRPDDALSWGIKVDKA